MEPTSKSSLPDNLSPERSVTDLLDSFVGKIQYRGSVITLDRLPSPAERKLLQARQREVTSMLRPAELASAEKERAVQAVSLLYAQYTNMRDPAETAEGIALTMAKELPLWAIVKACDDVYHGRVYDEDRKTGARKYLSPDYPVTGIRLAQVAGEYCRKLRDERVNIGNVLSCSQIRADLPDNRGRTINPRLPSLSDAHAHLEKHFQAQRKTTRDKMAMLADEQRERSVLNIYKQRGIEPQRNRHGVLIHPDILEMLPVGGEESVFSDD